MAELEGSQLEGSQWGINEPEPLFQILLHFCASNLLSVTSQDPVSGRHCLLPGLSLPIQIADPLLEHILHAHAHEPIDAYLAAFSEPERCHVRHVSLRDTQLGIDAFSALLRQQLVELDLTGCTLIQEHPNECLRQLRCRAPHLRSLHVGALLRNTLYSEEDSTPTLNLLCSRVAENISSEAGEEPADDEATRWSRLQALTVVQCVEVSCLIHLLAPLHALTYLDLSRSNVSATVLECVEQLSLLRTLILYNVPNLWQQIKPISRLKQLRALDVSCSQESHPEENLTYEFPEPARCLARLVQGLPLLRHLDISGTNLAEEGPPPATADDMASMECGIRGLDDVQLDVLGLQDCKGSVSPCTRQNLPARQVAGDSNEEQVILAAHLFKDKEELLVTALNNLFHIFRYSRCIAQKQALDVILQGMDRHPHNKRVQITGSASLFYIVKGEENQHLTLRIRRRIISRVLNAMENHMGETTMLHNGCLTLCHFTIPQDMLFVYGKLVRLLLSMVERDGQEDFLQRIGIYLINSLACQVEAREKRLLGDLGAINSMLHIIRQRLQSHQCDEVLEIAWGAMWNVTDETDRNCERFITGGGMELFLECWQSFPDKSELQKNMMGLMGNVAEVSALRRHLMKAQYLEVFCGLLEEVSDGIEISYNACGVLAHIMSDGPLAWTVDQPSRHAVSLLMIAAIQSWSIRTKRFINYRSFRPILQLLTHFASPEAQYWAVWALCNLTTMYPHKYCQLVELDGGFPLLAAVVTDPRAMTPSQQLAQQVLTLCQRYKIAPEQVKPGEEDLASDGED